MTAPQNPVTLFLFFMFQNKGDLILSRREPSSDFEKVKVSTWASAVLNNVVRSPSPSLLLFPLGTLSSSTGNEQISIESNVSENESENPRSYDIVVTLARPAFGVGSVFAAQTVR